MVMHDVVSPSGSPTMRLFGEMCLGLFSSTAMGGVAMSRVVFSRGDKTRRTTSLCRVMTWMWTTPHQRLFERHPGHRSVSAIRANDGFLIWRICCCVR